MCTLRTPYPVCPSKCRVWGAGTALPERNSGMMELIKLLVVHPQNVLACTQNPPFEAFVGLQKAHKGPKWLKNRPE